eukprot:TRINITY_DN101223_c0_g1_i1.p1 TRINITY_DN101223_c0_g1~~TRINITY_DN101223_c0_g1_i1.p1  ORF type:complete len:397 (-),score=113.87 TRINITY_DN101223_c0_g1_i1:170-1360(-)
MQALKALEGSFPEQQAPASLGADNGLVGGKYKAGRKIGAGSFGDIHLAVNVETEEEVALKLEKVSAPVPQLIYEAKLYKLIGGGPGIPTVHWYGTDGEYNVMVIDLLGPSLEDLFEFCDFRFNLKTVLMLADQMIARIEYVHAKNFLHRDIKPENFCMGQGKDSQKLHIIDFGLAKKFRDANNQRHIGYREHMMLTGTARYSSINTHLGIEQSRRDDLEAIGYVLFYFIRGSLPWQGYKVDTKDAKYAKIKEKKLATPIDALGKNLPKEFSTYMHYCRGLDFEDRPDYQYPRMILQELFWTEKFSLDWVYDWDIRLMQLKQEEEARFGTVKEYTNLMTAVLGIREKKGFEAKDDEERAGEDVEKDDAKGGKGISSPKGADIANAALLASRPRRLSR